MTANSTQRLQIFPSVYHSLVIVNFMCWANSSFFGGVSILRTLSYSYIIAFAIYDHNFQKGLVRQKLVLFRRCEKKMGTGDILLGLTLWRNSGSLFSGQRQRQYSLVLNSLENREKAKACRPPWLVGGLHLFYLLPLDILSRCTASYPRIPAVLFPVANNQQRWRESHAGV